MTYFRVDLRNLTFGELWRVAKLAFPITVLLKLLRVPLRLRQAIGVPPTPIRVDDRELDIEGRRARIQRDLDLLEQAGLRFCFPYKVPVVSPDSTTLGVAFLDGDGRTAGVVIDAVTRIGTKTQAMKQVALSTPLSSGRVLVTSSRSLLLAPPNVEEEIVRTGTTRLIARHAERLGTAISGARFVAQDGLLGYLEECERKVADFHIQRGVYVPMSAAEVEKLRGRKGRGVGWQLGQRALGWVLAIALLGRSTSSGRRARPRRPFSEERTAWPRRPSSSPWIWGSQGRPDPATNDAPFGESEVYRELRDRLGGLHRRRDEQTKIFEIEDPLEPYTAFWGWVERSDERLAGRMGLADPAVAAPAVLGWLCSDGAASVSYGFAEDAW